jgi:sensor domain CHASE-containing protein
MYDLDLTTLPTAKLALEKAERERVVVVEGPILLLQDLEALLCRTPIFVADSSGVERYWGVATVIVGLDELLMDAGLGSGTNGLREVLTVAGEEGETGKVLWGSEDVLAEEPVVTAVHLPSTVWALAAVPEDGWSAQHSRLLPLWAFGVLGAAALAWLTWSLAERQQRLVLKNQALEVSLGQVRRLSGLLPICAWCRKVRKDDGYWQQVESYVSERSEARFSHGICPDCEESEVESA